MLTEVVYECNTANTITDITTTTTTTSTTNNNQFHTDVGECSNTAINSSSSETKQNRKLHRGGGNIRDRSSSPQAGPSGLQLESSDVLTAASSPQASPSDTSSHLPDVVSIPTSSPPLQEYPELIDVRSNFYRCYTRHQYSIPSDFNADPILFLTAYRDFFIGEIRQYFASHSNNFPPTLKVFPQLSITLIKFSTIDEDISRNMHIAFRARLITSQDIDDLVNRWIDQLRSRLETLTSEVEGSGFIISSVNDFYINFCTYAAYSGIGSYIPYPSILRGKHEIFNPNGIQSSCVIQCIAAYKMRKQGRLWKNVRQAVERPTSCRKWVKSDGVASPVSWESLSKLEHLNRVSLYVYTLHKSDDRYHLSLSRKGNGRFSTVIPLLLLGGKHMTLIKDLESYYKKLTRRPMKSDQQFCTICFSSLPRTVNLRDHHCQCNFTQTLLFPDNHEKITFRNFAYS
ncbi:uncharacterized protein LOC126994942, partial [Eriocheir sinensis]|uniref:uncharacterized protein LOC126994942 n=1 Tax=Eriocheir sinensis TaxID=95602 RepID=UPI0021C83DB8